MRAVPRLQLRTLIAIETLPGGGCLGYPVIDPSLASFGDESDVREELRLFLSEHLAEQHPTVVARFALPESSEPRPFSLTLECNELPRAIRRPLPFDLHGVVIPHVDARWALLPSLGLGVYIATDESLEEVVVREIGRQLGALGGTLAEKLDLLPPEEIRFEWVDLSIQRRETIRDGTRKLRRELQRSRENNHATEILESVARALHRDPDATEGPEIVGRGSEIATLEALLRSDDRKSVLLVGEERVGKTAVLHGWLRARRAAGHVAGGGRALVYATSGAQLVAGMSGFGQWQERLRRVLDAAERLDAILYFDDLRDLFGSTGTSHVDLPGAMKTALDEGRVRVVGELPPEAVDRLAARHEGFFRNFHTVAVPPTNRDVAMEALRRRRDDAAKRDLEFSDDALLAVLSLSERYLPYRELPGKAVDLFQSMVRALDRHGAREESAIGSPRVHRLFSRQTGIPEVLLREDTAFRSERARAFFSDRVVGQEAATDAVVDTLCVVKSALGPGDKPLATFLFVGPTGVGKTELARALSEFLFGSEERLVRFDMSEYADPSAGDRLLRGVREGEDGELTRRVRQQPFGVVLLDEIEKAHRSVFDLLLQVAGEGRLTDAKGQTAHFHNTILILTSNLGAVHSAASLGIGAAPITDASRYERAVREAFRPEMVNRLDRVIPFAPLGPEHLQRIVHALIARIAERPGLSHRGASLRVADDAAARLAQDGHHEAYGARALRRHLEHALAGPIAEALTRSTSRQRGRVQIDVTMASAERPPRGNSTTVEAGPYRVTVSPSARVDTRGEMDTLERAAELRRLTVTDRARPSVEDAVARAEFLTTQLSHRKKKAKTLAAAERAMIQRELHMLSTHLEAIDAAAGEIEALEEVLVSASFERQALPDPTEDFAALRLEFRNAVLGLYLDLDPHHAITVLCEEMDSGRTLDGWLVSLLRDLERRDWRATLHFHGDPDPLHGSAYGAPTSAEDAIERILTPGRERLVVLMRMEGPHVGTLMSVECGLHRFFGIPPNPGGAHHRVKSIALRARIADGEWVHHALEPTRPGSTSEVLREGYVRWTDERPGQKLPDNYIHIPLDRYWTPESSDELALRTLIEYDQRDDLDRSMLYSAPLERPEGES